MPCTLVASASVWRDRAVRVVGLTRSCGLLLWPGRSGRRRGSGHLDIGGWRTLCGRHVTTEPSDLSRGHSSGRALYNRRLCRVWISTREWRMGPPSCQVRRRSRIRFPRTTNVANVFFSSSGRIKKAPSYLKGGLNLRGLFIFLGGPRLSKGLLVLSL